MNNRVINTLQDDINADNSGLLSTEFNNFINTLTGNVSNFINQLNNQNVSAIQGFGNLTNILTNIMSGYLANQTYNYDSSYLLTGGTNNCQQLAFNIAVDFGMWFLSGCNTFFNAYSGQQTLNVIIGNTFGNVSSSGNSTYHANSVQNSNGNTTIANINQQMGAANGSGTTVNGLGGFTPIGNPGATTSTTANQITLNNSAMNNDTTPIANSSADVGGSSTNTMDSIQIAKFLQEGFKLFRDKVQSVLYDTFKPYFLSFADVDLNVEGFNG